MDGSRKINDLFDSEQDGRQNALGGVLAQGGARAATAGAEAAGDGDSGEGRGADVLGDSAPLSTPEFADDTLEAGPDGDSGRGDDGAPVAVGDLDAGAGDGAGQGPVNVGRVSSAEAAASVAAVVASPAAAQAASAAAAPAAAQVPQYNGNSAGTASVSNSGDQSIDGILAGVKWSGTSISYSDPDSTADYQAGYPTGPLTGFSQMTAQQMDAVHFALNDGVGPAVQNGFSVEGFTNLSIIYAGSGTGSSTIRLANSSDPSTAYAYYPSTADTGGDAFFGPSGDFPDLGDYDWHTILHELGHSLGLKHGQGSLPVDEDSMEFSVMTYKSYVGQTTSGYTNETWGYAQTYMMNDIAALQYMYGADFTVNDTDTTYKWNPGSGDTLINGTVALATSANVIFATLWDGGGNDTYDLSSYTGGVDVDLAPGGWSVFDQTQLALLKSDGTEVARGSIFNALLYNGDTRSLIENAIGGSGDDRLSGNQASNTLEGRDGNDSLDGLDGNDTLIGGAGNDTMRGDVGWDTFRYDNGVTGNDSISGGSGTDRLLVVGTGEFDMTGFNVTSIEEIEFYAESGISKGVVLSNKELDSSTEFATDLRIDGNGLGTDTLIINFRTFDGQSKDFSTWIFQDWTNDVDEIHINGSSLANNFIGTTQNDIIDGLGGDDTLDGGAGIDTLSFASDSYGYGVDVNLAVGLLPGTGSFTGFERLLGSSYGDNLKGDTGANTIWGGDGNDTLDGGDGFAGAADSLDGGAGNDVLAHTGLANDTFNGGAGTDTLRSTGNWVNTVIFDLSAGRIEYSSNIYDTLIAIENLELNGSAQAIGDNGANRITGTSATGDNLFDGGGGADTLDGGGGDDTLKGGGNIDSLIGGDGNDWLEGGFSTDSINGGAGNDTIAVLDGEYFDSVDGGTGIDVLDATASTVSGVTIDFAGSTISGYGGGTLFNVEIYKDGSGANVIKSDGSGEFYGNAGNDTIFAGLGAAETLDGGTGTDTLDTTTFNGDYLINLTTGLTNWAGESFVNFENVQSGGGNDTLTGAAGDNILRGGDGNDRLDGSDGSGVWQSGNDSLYGEAGDDTLVYSMNNTGASSVGTYDGGTGTDTFEVTNAALTSAWSVDLSTGQFLRNTDVRGTLVSIENVTVRNAMNVTGDANANLIQGVGVFNNVFSGGAGNDTIYGDAGEDILRGGSGWDVIEGGSYNDLLYGDGGNDTLRGGTSFDTIYGGTGNDLLRGQGGKDQLYGGTGNDRALGDNGNDTVYGEAGRDLIKGGAGWDILYGGDDNDTILGDKGRDRIDGGAGDDTLQGGALDDTFIFADGFGQDVIRDFSASDGEKIDLSAVTGITDFNDLMANHLVDVSGIAMIVDGSNSIYLAGVAYSDVGVGQLYSGSDFIF